MYQNNNTQLTTRFYYKRICTTITEQKNYQVNTNKEKKCDSIFAFSQNNRATISAASSNFLPLLCVPHERGK